MWIPSRWPAVGTTNRFSLQSYTTGSQRESACHDGARGFRSPARLPSASISPDGRRLALIQTSKDRAAAVVFEWSGDGIGTSHVVLGEPPGFRLSWCHWATNTRLLCGFHGFVYGVSRLVATDADGGHMLVLLQNSQEVQGQFQDRIINWHPGTPNAVLVEADEGLSPQLAAGGAEVYGNVGTRGAPAVYELDVLTGRLTMRERARAHPALSDRSRRPRPAGLRARRDNLLGLCAPRGRA